MFSFRINIYKKKNLPVIINIIDATQRQLTYHWGILSFFAFMFKSINGIFIKEYVEG